MRQWIILQASRVSSMFKFFLLLAFVSSFIPVALFIANVSPSNACGPFKSQSGFFDVVTELIDVSHDMNFSAYHDCCQRQSIRDIFTDLGVPCHKLKKAF
jgi:hypothetical protein